MSREVPGDVLDPMGGSVAASFLQDLNDHDAVGFLQEWQGVPDGAARLARVLPRDRNSLGRERCEMLGRDQHGPARFEDRAAGIEPTEWILALRDTANDDEIG